MKNITGMKMIQGINQVNPQIYKPNDPATKAAADYSKKASRIVGRLVAGMPERKSQEGGRNLLQPDPLDLGDMQWLKQRVEERKKAAIRSRNLATPVQGPKETKPVIRACSTRQRQRSLENTPVQDPKETKPVIRACGTRQQEGCLEKDPTNLSPSQAHELKKQEYILVNDATKFPFPGFMGLRSPGVRDVVSPRRSRPNMGGSCSKVEMRQPKFDSEQ